MSNKFRRNFLQTMIIMTALWAYAAAAWAGCEVEEKAVSQAKQELFAALSRASQAAARRATGGYAPVRRGDGIEEAHVSVPDEIEYRKARSVQRNSWLAWRKARTALAQCAGRS